MHTQIRGLRFVVSIIAFGAVVGPLQRQPGESLLDAVGFWSIIGIFAVGAALIWAAWVFGLLSGRRE